MGGGERAGRTSSLFCLPASRISKVSSQNPTRAESQGACPASRAPRPPATPSAFAPLPAASLAGAVSSVACAAPAPPCLRGVSPHFWGCVPRGRATLGTGRGKVTLGRKTRRVSCIFSRRPRGVPSLPVTHFRSLCSTFLQGNRLPATFLPARPTHRVVPEQQTRTPPPPAPRGARSGHPLYEQPPSLLKKELPSGEAQWFSFITSPLKKKLISVQL